MFGYQDTYHRPSPRTLCSVIYLGVLATIMSVGCAVGSGASSSEPASADYGDAHLRIVNRHLHSVQIVIQPLHGSALRLGRVRVDAERTLRLPRTLNGIPVRLRLRCLHTGDTHDTPQFTWNASERIDLALESLLSLSTVTLPGSVARLR